MGKWLKAGFFVVLLIGAVYFFGAVCKQVGGAYELILSPSRELLDLLLWFLLAVGTVMISAGLVAALLRPVWVGMIAFILSGLALLLGWQVTVGSALLVLVYLVVAAVYAVGVAGGLSERIRFSVGPIGESQGLLLMVLILVVCGSLYLGYAEYIEREGFSPPEYYIDLFMEQIEKQIAAQAPPGEREETVAEFREEFRRGLDDFFETKVKPHEELIPLVVAASLFLPLQTITSLLAWVPVTVLRLAFPLFRVLRVTRVVTETQEVQRMVIG